MCMNSEITSTAETDIYDSTSIYTTELKTWADNEISKIDSKITLKVAFCHEAPFTIMTEDTIMKFASDSTTERGGSHLNILGSYWFSKFLQENGFKLCICGHKHTYANSRLIHENAGATMCPTVYDTSATPTWYTSLSDRNKTLCTVSTDKTIPYVKYVMCQATGYKLISNKFVINPISINIFSAGGLIHPNLFLAVWLSGFTPLLINPLETNTFKIFLPRLFSNVEALSGTITSVPLALELAAFQ